MLINVNECVNVITKVVRVQPITGFGMFCSWQMQAYHWSAIVVSCH